jgi:hypothetical protein
MEAGMRGAAVLAAMIIGGPGLTAACGQQQAAVLAPAGSPAPRCTAPASPQAVTLTIKNADNGQVRCAGIGEHVLVYLSGTPAHKWGPIHSSSKALTPEANGRLALKVGLTGAFFAATHPGTASITSTRSTCQRGASTGCGTSMVFHVTVVVSGPPDA